MQDFEFTIQDDKLYMLQTRNGKRTGYAAVMIAVDMVDEKLITPKEAVLHVDPESLVQLLHPVFDPKAWKALPVDDQGPARVARRGVGPGRSSPPTTPSSGRGKGRRSSSSATRPCPTTSTACTWPQGILTAPAA